MKKITANIIALGQMVKKEMEEFTDWVWRLRAINMFDPRVLTYPRTVMCRADDGENALLYIPLQSVLIYDAIAAKPGITPRQEALCLWRIGEVVDKAAQEIGVGEVYFFCMDDRVSDICSQHGFEEIKNVRVLRRRVPDSQPISRGQHENPHEVSV